MNNDNSSRFIGLKLKSSSVWDLANIQSRLVCYTTCTLKIIVLKKGICFASVLTIYSPPAVLSPTFLMKPTVND